ncbi:MAG: UDP-N-acetylglucosamine 2-epimerase (non-hydrolyzing) [Bacteroides sp.]|nr:UDP-N-acetylglucosamine 2-epimerase (non-hydrolyzing) [Ruminococcus flavefaciens]MCM1555547.1 UDP-N-acetylglucosamine 2-epimerase (non-hydrolyzing) [Bacteroides sp.]
MSIHQPSIKIATVVGARPQFVKAAALSRAFAGQPGIEEFIIHTGQHYDDAMSEVFFRELEIPSARYHLGISKETMPEGERNAASVLGKTVQEIARVLEREKPRWVLVYGDTDSTLTGALAAAKCGIELIHVEAGLRSYNDRMPEELNRVLADRMSRLLFCPTDRAVKNLQKEGFDRLSARIFRVGDLMQDAAVFYSPKAKPIPDIKECNNFVLCTIHRIENTSNPTVLNRIFQALDRVAERMPLVMPLHPGTRKRLQDNGYGFDRSNIRFIEPVGYLEMVFLLQHCHFVMTDSGGVQKEAYFFGKMCLTLREETEWTELVENRCNILVGSDVDKITETAGTVWESDTRNFVPGLYGQGNTGAEIARIILQNS